MIQDHCLLVLTAAADPANQAVLWYDLSLTGPPEPVISNYCTVTFKRKFVLVEIFHPLNARSSVDRDHSLSAFYPKFVMKVIIEFALPPPKNNVIEIGLSIDYLTNVIVFE